MQSVILGRSPHHNSRLRIHAAAAATGTFSRTHRTKAAKDELGLEQELGKRSLRGLCGGWGLRGASGAGAEQAAKAQSGLFSSLFSFSCPLAAVHWVCLSLLWGLSVSWGVWSV